jgi:predicted kinase
MTSPLTATTLPDPGPAALPRARTASFVLVGGIPGAGKSTALRAVAADRAGATVLDPDDHRRRLAALLPARVPYRWYRGVVHTLHTVCVLAVLLAGPRLTARGLAVHDPATRPVRRAATARLARWRGWAPELVLLDVDRDTALAGQRARGRTLRSGSFARHWRRWSAQRPALASGATGSAGGGWQRIHLVPRDEAVPLIRRLLHP